MDILFVFMRPINHIFIDVEHPAAIDEIGIEPKVECRLVSIVELDTNVIVDTQVEVAVDIEINVAHIANVLLPVLRDSLIIDFPLVKDVAFADNLEIRKHASPLQVRNRDHSNLVYLLHCCFIYDGAFDDSLVSQFQEMLKIVHISDLRRNCHPLAVKCPDLPVI